MLCGDLNGKETPKTGIYEGFLGGSDGKESTGNTGDLALIPGLGQSSGEGNGYPLQYFCLENYMNRGVRQVTVHGFIESICPTLQRVGHN